MNTRMNIEKDISITEPITVADILNDLSGHEAAERGGLEDRNLTTENVRPYFKPWRVFINHIDSYHGKSLVDVLSDTVYIDPRNTRVDVPSNDEQGKEFEDEDDHEYVEEGEREKRKWPDKSAVVLRKYDVIGTVLDREYLCPDDVTVIMRNSDDKNLLLSELMTCGVIIYDITQEPNMIEEACWILKEIVRALERTEEKSPKVFKREPTRRFMLISTIMTWALTKPLDPADPDLPFTEADYRKRKPHPNYKEHIRCEREVVTVRKRVNLKNNLKTLVICCGVTYGEGEGPLHYLFKMAWQNAPFLPIFGKGHNKIPLLHVRNLVAIVSAVLQNWPAKRYIVAVERELISQNTIVEEISRSLGSGKVKNVTKQEALLLPEVSQRIHDIMTVDLNIDPVYIIDRIRRQFDMPFRGALDEIVKEYKSRRKLGPVKIVVLGPPASGKTRVARYLADHYEISYVHVKTLISDTIQRLIDDIRAARSGGGQGDDLEDTTGDDDNDKEEEQDEKEVVASTAAKLQKQLDEIRTSLATNNGRLDDVVLNKLFLKRLKSRDCLNQGYVIDGYPKTLEQARMLFLISDGDSREQEQIVDDEFAEAKNADITILPELVVVLEANDKFLKERIMNLPQSEIQGTHYTEEHMLRRMKEYRERNTDDNTPLQLFDEMEIYPLVISVETDVCPDMFPTVYQCLEKLGKPRNYGLETRRGRVEAEARAAEAAEKLRQEGEMLERKRQREEKMMEWTRLTEKLKQEEEERLCVLAEPLRHYLATHVLPTLTEALIEVAKLRPEDPVDFLAEYLFKKNPEGRMFEPDYTETMSMLLDVINRQRNNVLPMEELNANIAQFTKSQDELSSAGETGRSEDDFESRTKFQV